MRNAISSPCSARGGRVAAARAQNPPATSADPTAEPAGAFHCSLAAGGGLDFVARVTAEYLSRHRPAGGDREQDGCRR
jgi:hypothetical protein